MGLTTNGPILAVIDSDRSGVFGNDINANELALIIDGITHTPSEILLQGVGTSVTNILGLDFGLTGIFNDTPTEKLFAIAEINEYVPENDLGTVADIDSVVDLTINAAGTVFIIDGQNQLVRVERDSLTGQATTTTVLGVIKAANSLNFTTGYDELTGIMSIEVDPSSGTLYVIADDFDTNGQALYTIGTSATDIDADAMNDIVASKVAGLQENNSGNIVDVEGDITAISFANAGNQNDLFAVINNGSKDSLLRVNLNTPGIAERLGDISFNNVSTIITGMDADIDGNLILVHNNTSSQGQLLLISNSVLGGDATNTALEAIELTAVGTVSDTAQGFASDSTGQFYDVNNDGASPNPILTLRQSTSNTPVLGELVYSLDADTLEFDGTVTFTPIRSLDNIASVQTMAFANGVGDAFATDNIQDAHQALYIIANGNELYEVNVSATTGEDVLQLIGTLADVDNLTGSVNIGSMDFDSNNSLFAQDLTNGRLIQIDIPTFDSGATTTPQALFAGVSPDGTLRNTVSEISYDFINDRFLVADNATSLMNTTASNDSAIILEITGTDLSSAFSQNIGDIFIDGTITGKVNISGSVGDFYAGWLLTGNTQGDVGTSHSQPSVNDNFFVGGDLRNLTVKSFIGTQAVTVSSQSTIDVTYTTGFNLHVGGKLGQVLSMNSIDGQIEVDNSTVNISNLDSSYAQTEIEFKLNDDKLTYGDLFAMGYLDEASSLFHNDTFETAQVLGSVRESGLDQPDIINLNGQLDGINSIDLVDYYAVALKGGQTITIDLNGLEFQDPDTGEFFIDRSSFLNLGVYDNQGRLVATDYSDVNSFQQQSTAFQFTADEPGLYRIAVAVIGDTNFNGILDNDETQINTEDIAKYNLVIRGVGNMAVGGVVSREHLFSSLAAESLIVRNGDLGAVWVTDTQFYRHGFEGSPNINVQRGDLRVDIAGTIGIASEDFNGLNIEVADGDVGLIQSTVGNLNLDSAIVGGDLQVIDGLSTVYVDITIDAGLGVIRAGDMGTVNSSSIQVNADNLNLDGVIDLIDVEGNFGILGNGTSIDTGLGGNVRFINVGGNVYQDSFFGGGLATSTVLAAGESTILIDDSGAKLTIAPLDSTINTDATSGLVTVLANLEYVTYGVRSSGGQVLISLTSSDGVSVAGYSNGVGNRAEIGTIIALGTGTPVINPDEQVTSIETPPEVDTDGNLIVGPLLQVVINTIDNTAIDVWKVTGSSTTTTGETVGVGDFYQIHNNTKGDIVNVSAASIDSLFSNGSLGLATSSTGTTISPRQVISDVYPFLNQHIGIVSGNVNTITTHEGLGNVIVDGYIGTVNVNHDNINQSDIFEGISAPIFATGDIYYVNIGEGLAASGNGEFAQSGIYSQGFIFDVVNQGEGSDIYGNIVSQQGIGNISLINGVIANSNIMVLNDVAQSVEFTSVYSLSTTAFSQPTVPVTTGLSFEDSDILNAQYQRALRRYNASGGIDRISMTGNGGMIGSNIAANQVNDFVVDNGFGLLNSLFLIAEGNDYGNFTVDGYGIRDVVFKGGNDFNSIVLDTTGGFLDPTSYSLGARPSMQIDGIGSPLNDLIQYLAFSNDMTPADLSSMLANFKAGTVIDQLTLGLFGNLQDTGTAAGVPDIFQAGLLANTQMTGTGNLNTLRAYQVRETANGYHPSEIRFVNQITNFQITDVIQGLELTAGTVGTFSAGSDLLGSNIHIAGEVTNFSIGGDFDIDSSLTVEGYNGFLNSFSVTGNMDGRLTVAGSTNAINVDGDLTGFIELQGANSNLPALVLLDVNHSLSSDNFFVDGDVTTINVGDDATGSLVITGDLRTMNVGTTDNSANTGRLGGDLLMDLLVEGDLGTLLVNGVIEGDVQVYGNVTSQIRANRLTPNVGALLGTSFTNVIDLTAISSTEFYVINENAGAFELYYLLRNADGTFNSSTLRGTLNDGSNLTNVQAIEVDPTDSTKLYVVANDPTDIGTAANGQLHLFVIDITNGLATDILDLDIDFDITEQYSSLSFVGSNLYLVNAIKGVTNYGNQLYKIVGLDGSVALSSTNTGPIDLPTSGGFTPATMYVSAMDTDADGNLRLFITDSTDPDNGSIIELSNPNITSFSIPGLLSGFVSATAFFPSIGFSLPNFSGFSNISSNYSLQIPSYSRSSASSFNTVTLSEIGAVNNATGYTSDNDGLFYQISDNVTDDVLFQTQSVAGTLAQFGLSLISGNVIVHGFLNSITANKGHITGDVMAGGNINAVTVANGSLGLDHRMTLSSTFGDIGNVSVSNGNINAQVVATNGSINSFSSTASSTSTASQVRGDLLATSSINARQLTSMTLGGDIQSGVNINSEYHTNTFNVTGNVEDGASVTLGDLSNATIGGNFKGDLTVNAINGSRPTFTVNGDMDGTANFGENATVVVKGDFGTDSTSNARLNIDGNGWLFVTGDMHGDLIVGSRLEHLTARNIQDSVIVAGGRIDNITVTQDIEDSIIQAGLSAGNDGMFASANNGTGFPTMADTLEGGTLEKIVNLTAKVISNSIIAAGHDINTFRANTSISNSTVVSGFVLGHSAIADALNRNTNGMTTVDIGSPDGLSANERADLLGRADRMLYYGDLGTVALGTGSSTNVDVVAGIDVGNDGVFGTMDDSLIHISDAGTYQGGGISQITNISGNLDGTSYVAADSKIQTNTSGLAGVVVNPSTTDFLASLGHTLNGSPQTQASGNVTYAVANGLIKVQVFGPDTVYVYDSNTGDDLIDAIYIVKGAANTNFTQTSVTIQYSTNTANDTIQIGQIITTDDVKIGNLDFFNLNGTSGSLVLAGDSDSSTPDLWIDATNEVSRIRMTNTNAADSLQVAANFTGYISGRMEEFELGTIDPTARINVAGDIQFLTLISTDFDTTTISTASFFGDTTPDTNYLLSTTDAISGNTASYYVVSTTVNDVTTTQGMIDVYDSMGALQNTYASDVANLTGLE
ncbi:MAG: hypothetical protein JKX85_10495 [Phycisphaeraceae bacterium]|nr:hypothetical protein [Phycisphaeraceae bacterium]